MPDHGVEHLASSHWERGHCCGRAARDSAPYLCPHNPHGYDCIQLSIARPLRLARAVSSGGLRLGWERERSSRSIATGGNAPRRAIGDTSKHIGELAPHPPKSEPQNVQFLGPTATLRRRSCSTGQMRPSSRKRLNGPPVVEAIIDLCGEHALRECLLRSPRSHCSRSSMIFFGIS